MGYAGSIKIGDKRGTLKLDLGMPRKQTSAFHIPEESAESTNYMRSSDFGDGNVSPGMELIRNCRETQIKVEQGK